MKTVAQLLAIAALLGAIVFGAATRAAPVGDQTPKGSFGTTCVLMDDGGTNIATAMWTTGTGGTRLSGSNAFSVFNPTASSGTIYCGWKANVTSTTGYPVCQGCSLSVDVTCPATGTCPMLYCTTGSAVVNQTTPNCSRWIQVK